MRYTSHPDKWEKRDLRVLDRLIEAFGSNNPLRYEAVPLDLYDDVKTACLASYHALRELRTHLANNGRKL